MVCCCPPMCLTCHLAGCLPTLSTLLYSWRPHSVTSLPFVGNLRRHQPSAELMGEIASLEMEIMHLERYLLSLYRTAFEQHLPTLMKSNGPYLLYNSGSPMKVIADQSCYKIEPDMWKGGRASHSQTSPPCGLAGFDNPSHAAPPKTSSDQKSADPGHRSLADHFGASCIDEALYTPHRLSEDIVKCMSSIYCRLANPTSTHAGFSVSSTSSLSSSSIFSPRNVSDSWSPHCNGEATGLGQFQGFKRESIPHAAMIEVSKICVDDNSFNYAARMLQKFRSLVKSLENIDPRKMKREEKLAFWINIHNALVMHAYLAYGTHTHVRSTSILKAAYNVGGHCINAYIIQSSILGIRSHHSLPTSHRGKRGCCSIIPCLKLNSLMVQTVKFNSYAFLAYVGFFHVGNPHSQGN
ncbi:hypothetical protein ACSBR1_000022 [Camellia fascicularis]